MHGGSEHPKGLPAALLSIIDAAESTEGEVSASISIRPRHELEVALLVG